MNDAHTRRDIMIGLAACGVSGVAPAAVGARPAGPRTCPERECGWVYDPAIGDPEHGIAPGTPFEDLPADWVCPECGREKHRW